MDLPGMMNSEPPAKRYADMDALSRSLAGDIAAQLTRRDRRARPREPGRLGRPIAGEIIRALRVQALDWNRVCVALADERWVDPTDAGQQ